jgi:hypothetical protein
MKIGKKDIIFWILIAGVFTVFFIITLERDSNPEATPTPTPVASPKETATPAPEPTKYILPTTKPKGEIKVEEVGAYERLFAEMDPENRVLGVYAECQQLIPSNVAYKNNTEVMLDNTRSTKSHILKIGNADYSLDAGEWRLVKLSSPTVPINMIIFCEGIELGAIELQ